VGAPPPSRAEKKVFRGNLQEEIVIAPQAEQESTFKDSFLLGGKHLEGWSGSFSSFSLCY